ncbi:hypothetical protein [Sporocytophaga myxococcoides]|uniref:hypothetical protein n=1 Tax=Sporocytophaga myxococcoides TaxID=153721 RepID=UPI0003FC6344|nr:hypothetical protein [Sporocytophaga myxococcoides]
MIKKVKDIIYYLTEKPEILFLTDSLGAMLTAFILFVLSRNFNEYIGMPIIVLTYLSVIAACFSIYSIACYFFLKENRISSIIAISVSNLLYCVLTIGLIIVYHPILTIAGITYFSMETIVICGLVFIELKVASEINKNRFANN